MNARAAPSATLRVVPLPRFTEEDGRTQPHGSFPVERGKGILRRTVEGAAATAEPAPSDHAAGGGFLLWR